MPTFQVRAALADDRVQKYLNSDNYRSMAAEDRLGGLVGKIVRIWAYLQRAAGALERRGAAEKPPLLLLM